MTSPVLHIPKDIFIRLHSCFGQGPNQGILYGVREECFGKGLINFQGQTVLGWFSNPDAETLSTFSFTQVADAYFETFQSAILKVISANSLHLTSDVEADNFSNRIMTDCFRFFQDLVGLVIYRSTDIRSKKKASHAEPESCKIITRGFYSHVVAQDIRSAISEMNKRVRPDQLEEAILREFKLVRDKTKTECILDSNINVSDTRLAESPPTNQSNNGRIDDSLDWSPTPLTQGHHPHEKELLAKRASNESANTQTPKKRKTGSVPLNSVHVIPGQGSEFISQSMNADSLHYSTEFDEMAFGMDSICQNSAERLEQLRSRKAMIEGFIDNTSDLVDSYEYSCREYEMLLHCLQVLSEPMDVLKRQLEGIEPRSLASDTNNLTDEEDVSSTTSRDQSSNLEHDPESTDTEPERHLMVRLTTESIGKEKE
ncbi:hypothetical protein K7432_013849 [Basidiobolus ranarum]|uniref:Uncharacterized protein n=1 Tax=Basidiobolus ranarum TaxID=34480 RepID=A0ABR2WIJ6_9FUNG